MWTSVSDQPTWSPQACPFVALPIKTLAWVTGTLKTKCESCETGKDEVRCVRHFCMCNWAPSVRLVVNDRDHYPRYCQRGHHFTRGRRCK